MAVYSDDFNRANETPLATGTWGQSGTGSFNLASNQVSHPNDANDNEVYYVAAAASGDQHSQIKFTGGLADAGEQGCGVVCRHIGSATRTFIRAVVDSTGAITVRSFTGGVGTLIGSRAGTFAVNDVLRMEVTGTSPNIVVRVFKNGVQVGADFTGVSGPNTGKPGLCYSSSTSTPTTMDDWQGGDLAVAVVAATNPIRQMLVQGGRLRALALHLIAPKAPPAAAGVITVALTQALETDTGFAITALKAKAITLATETDTAFAVGHFKSHLLGLATETDTAFALTRVKSRTLGLATETDTAFATGKAKAKLIGLATEIDTAFALAGRTFVVTIAVETDTAFAIKSVKSRLLGIALETDTAFPVRRQIERALELDQALAIGHFKSRTLGLASETDTAFTITRRKTKAIVMASESDLALPITAIGGAAPLLGQRFKSLIGHGF